VLISLGFSGCGGSKSTGASKGATTAPQTSNAGQPSPSSATSASSTSLAAGTPVEVALVEVFDTDTSIYTQFLVGHVAADVKGSDGGIAIPAGSATLLLNRGIGRAGTHSIAEIGLNRIEVGGKTFKTADGVKDIAVLHLDEDSTKGVGHRSVHLEKNSTITFKLSENVQLR
jgi:hypothetical protein